MVPQIPHVPIPNSSNGTAWKWVGYLEVLTGFLITGYYAVVSGWCLQYVYASIMGELHGDPTFVANYFKEFSSDPVRPVMWTVAIFLICHFVIIHGVRGGIEKASKVMMPLLFILLLIIVVAACLLPDAGKGVEFLLKPDFRKGRQKRVPECLGTVVLFYEYRYGLYLYLCLLLQPSDQSLQECFADFHHRFAGSSTGWSDDFPCSLLCRSITG